MVKKGFDYDVLMIFEDDAELVDDFDLKLARVMAELPSDWDGLWLGGSKVTFEDYSPLLWRLKLGTGGYCVMMRKRMMEKCLPILEREDTIADICYAQCMADLNVYRTKENLVKHKPGYSLIQQRFVDYPELA